jgi:hypothetical protein
MSIISLYEMNGDLLWSNQRQNERGKLKQFIKLPRQADDLLDSWFAELVDVWNAILEELPMLRNTPTNYRSSAGEDFERDGQMVTNHLLFRPIGLGMLAGVVRRLLDEHPDSSPKEAIKGLSAIEWRLHQAPWRHLLSVYDSEADRWKMRTDKEAQQVAANILDFVTQVQRHDEGTLETLRDNWKDLLQNPEPGYEEDGWQAVRDAAVRFGNARK